MIPRTLGSAASGARKGCAAMICCVVWCRSSTGRNSKPFFAKNGSPWMSRTIGNCMGRAASAFSGHSGGLLRAFGRDPVDHHDGQIVSLREGSIEFRLMLTPGNLRGDQVLGIAVHFEIFDT